MNKHIVLIKSLSYKLICCFIFVSATQLTSYSQTKHNLDSLLSELDKTIDKSQIYIQKREERIRLLKSESKRNTPLSVQEYDINNRLFTEYKPFICDSALLYQNKNIEIAIHLKDIYREYDSKIQVAFLMGSTGMYMEAVDLLKTIDRQKLPESLVVNYYYTYLRVYNELAFYTQDRKSSENYWKMSGNINRELKQVIDRESSLYLQLKEDSVRNSQDFDGALKINDIWLLHASEGTPDYALATFHRAIINLWKGNKEEYKYNLILSAIADIKSAIKDQASLRMLAEILYDEGDIDRAYNYIRFSWNATVFYNAKLRSLQTATILSLIDKTYQGKIEKQKSKLQNYLILISSLFVLLAIALLVIFKQNKRLSNAKAELQNANSELNNLNRELNKVNEDLTLLNSMLNKANNELSDSNKIKEVYIGRFIELCSVYINKIDNFRRKVNAKIKDGKIKDAQIFCQSQDIMDEEFEELYYYFDNAFLQLFPDFVDKVNELLSENNKFILKKGELLNPELRIIALIRLGINDGTKISLFLRYSLTTVYNYRTKTKNRTFLPKEEFDAHIQQIH
ncbi:MAG: transcriptional regulator [Bacteroidetes bacterium]|nr:transcriptional regulator [Bacteroidota bacterium]